MTQMPRMAFAPGRIFGLDDTTQAIFDELIVQWQQKMPRNIERMIYLDGKNKLKDLKVSLPPQLVDVLDIVMGWPEKAVYELANRIVLERILDADGGTDPFELRRTLYDNRFEVEFPQAIASSLAHSLAFATTTLGDRSAGEPDALLMFHSAMFATGLWDKRRRALRAGLLINSTDELGKPTTLTVLLPTENLVCARGASGAWAVVSVHKHSLGRTSMEMLPFRPTLERPYGRSRIDRRVMSLTDRAVRGGARLEVHSELFSAMKLILLGADEDSFRDQNGNKVPLWSFYMGRLNMLSRDEDGEVPKLEKITAESPEPHIAVMRQLASEFSGHTGVPLGSLGIATDNPESAQSKTVAREDLVADAEKQQTIYGATLRRLLENTIMLRDDLDTPPDGILDLQFKWRRPDRPTDASAADAGQKRVAASPNLAETSIGLELLGLEPDQVDRAMSELRRKQSSGVLDRVLASRTSAPDSAGSATTGAPSGSASGATASEDAVAVKAKFDALGSAVRAGVDPEDAAARVGLAGVRFTGAVPVSLRMPEQEAAELEER